MKKMNIIILLVLTLVLASCTMDNNVEEDDLDVSGSDAELVEKSESISDIVVEQFGIDDAVTIVFNEYALIAVKIAYNDDITQQQIGEITNIVKDNYDEIEEVLITDNSRIFKEIDDMVFGLLQGNSYNEYLDDINNIKNRLSRSSS